MNNLLRTKLRTSFIIWLICLFGLSYFVFSDTIGFNSFSDSVISSAQKPFNNFFRGKLEQIPTPEPVIEPESTPLPEPIPEPPKENKMEIGKAKGSGVIGNIAYEITNDSIILNIPYEGTLGNYTSFEAKNVSSKVTDLQGDFIYKDRNISFEKNSFARAVQSAKHKGYVRISLLLNKGVAKPVEEIFYTDKLIIIKFNFVK